MKTQAIEPGFLILGGMYQTTFTQPSVFTPPNPLVLQELRGLKEEAADIFRFNFDTGYFLPVIDQAAFDSSRLRDIRQFLYGADMILQDPSQAGMGIEALLEFTAFCRTYISPYLRELMGISGFNAPAGHSPQARTLQAVKGMFAYTYPYNIARLEELGRSLQKCRELLWVE